MTPPSYHDATASLLALQQHLHDLNQPLTAIGNYAHAGQQLAALDSPDIARLQSIFDKIVTQHERACQLARLTTDAISKVTTS